MYLRDRLIKIQNADQAYLERNREHFEIVKFMEEFRNRIILDIENGFIPKYYAYAPEMRAWVLEASTGMAPYQEVWDQHITWMTANGLAVKISDGLTITGKLYRINLDVEPIKQDQAA